MVSDAGRAAGTIVGRYVRVSGRALVIVAAFVLGACARDEAPTANWRTTSEPVMTPLAPITTSPEAPVVPSASPSLRAPMAPSMQTLTPPAQPSRNPCLTRWGSPRLDAPEDCASKGPRASRVLPGRGVYKIGKPYTVRGRTYVPAENPAYDEVGTASWYGGDFHGGKTANGEIFDMHALTAAHKTLPLPSFAHVRNEANGRTILVRINNRGPFAGDRIIDVSHAAARLLGFDGRGLAKVRVTYVGRAPLDGGDQAERAFLAQQPWYGPELALGAR